MVNRTTVEWKRNGESGNLYPTFPSHSYTLAVRFHSYLAATKKNQKRDIPALRYPTHLVAFFPPELAAYLESFALV